MNEQVKAFLDAKKDAEKKKYEEQKNKTLLELGLFEIVYSEKEGYSNDFPYSEYDNETSKDRWYKKEVISISDDEYEEVKKYLQLEEEENKQNLIATLLKVIGVVVYIVGFIAAFPLSVDSYGDTTPMVIVWWIIFFISGTFYLGFAEIIQLLNDIKNK